MDAVTVPEAPSVVDAATGLSVCAATLLPGTLVRTPGSMPSVFLGTGTLILSSVDALPDPDPMTHGDVTVHLTEACVIVGYGTGGLLRRAFLHSRIPSIRLADRSEGFVALVAVMSVLLAGTTADPATNALDRARKREAHAETSTGTGALAPRSDRRVPH